MKKITKIEPAAATKKKRKRRVAAYCCVNWFLGYDKGEEGKLILNPEEAEVVRRIFREYLERKNYYEIGKGLTADGIKTVAGSDFWLASTMRKTL